MRMSEYVDLINEINTKNGVEWDNLTSTLAIYQYMQSLAVSEYYNNFEMKRSSSGFPVICEVVKNGAVVSAGDFKFDGIRGKYSETAKDIAFEMFNYGHKPAADATFLTNAIKKQIESVRERFLNSESFAEFADGFSTKDYDNYYLLEDKLDFKIGKFMRAASLYNENKDEEHSWHKKTILENVLSVMDDTYKFANHRHQTLIMPILNLTAKDAVFDNQETYDNLYTVGAYDEVMAESFYFNRRPVQEKIDHYLRIAQMPKIKDNTILGMVINHPENIIHKLADKFVFDEIKNLALLQTRLALKSSTLEDLLESRPIVDEIYEEAIKRFPLLETPMDERFEHKRIIDKEYDLQGEESVSFAKIMDGVGLYGKDNDEHYLSIQTEIIVFPRGTTEIKNKQPTERFIGHDGVGPYYVVFANQAPLTVEVDSLVFEQFHISKHLDNKHVRQLFVNMFEECMTRQLPLVIENSNFHNIMNDQRLKLFEEVRSEYKGIVPTVVTPIGLNKYRALLETELTYSQILAIEPKLDELVNNRCNLDNYKKLIEAHTSNTPEIKKSTPKL
jgi:hypothetical protein